MSADDLRKRLEALNGGPLAHMPLPGSTLDDAPAARRAVSEMRAAEAVDSRFAHAAIKEDTEVGSDRAHPLDSSLFRHVGGESRSLASGRSYYHVEKRLVDGGHLSLEAGLAVSGILQSASFRDQFRRPVAVRAEDTLFLDLETLGLHGEPLFLIGMLKLTADGEATCHQLLARDLDEEAVILERCITYLRGVHLLITYNGKSFDVPFLKSRIERHNLRFPRTPAHADLLVEARLRYRGRFSDCRLQTLERHLCGRTRIGDVPGARIPAVYRECIRTGDAAPLAAILHHNLLDLATTAQLVSHFWGQD